MTQIIMIWTFAATLYAIFSLLIVAFFFDKNYSKTIQVTHWFNCVFLPLWIAITCAVSFLIVIASEEGRAWAYLSRIWMVLFRCLIADYDED